jgi:hypothetical protein
MGIGNRFRNTSPVFRFLLVLLLVILLILLALLVFLQFLLPIIRPTPGPTPGPGTPSPSTLTATAPFTGTQPPTPTSTPVVVPTVTGTLTPGTPGPTTGTPAVTRTAPGTTTPGTISPTGTVVGARNLLRNGNFEEGFQSNELGRFWNSFNNGNADFSFHIDDWPLVVVEGDYTQLIEIKNAQLTDRYLGIYQTADVVPGRDYTFSMRGLIRTNTGNVEQTSYGYRLQVGFDPTGGQDWKAVEDWIELTWDEQLRIQDSFRFDAFTTTVRARSDELTVFVRAWKKWADSGEGDYDVDDIRLVEGGAGATPTGPGFPVTGGAFDTIWDNVRVWATIALLLLLLGGAVWRLRWQNR